MTSFWGEQSSSSINNSQGINLQVHQSPKNYAKMFLIRLTGLRDLLWMTEERSHDPCKLKERTMTLW